MDILYISSVHFFQTINYSILVAFISAAAALALAPGPDNIYVITQSLSNGVKAGLATVSGLISGCLVHTTLLAFGVSEVIKRSDLLFNAIKIFGALYLLYLSYKVFKSDASIILEQENMEKKGLGRLFRIGFTMNVLNPKVTIFFLAFFPGFLFSETLNTVIQFYVLGLLFMLVAFLIFSALALLAGRISAHLTRNPEFGGYLKWLQILVFVGIAIYLFF